MAKFTLQDVVDCLETGWATYIADFNNLPPEAQAAFLEKQGFTHFRDVLAHIIAWWEEGHRVMVHILDDTDFIDEPRNVDAFNAEAIRRFSMLKLEDLVDYYHRMRQVLLNLLGELGEDALENEIIADWLYADVIEHLEEHKVV
jgi:DinB family protein